MDEVSTLQIHHITAYSIVKKHEAENLILVCSNCHLQIGRGEISASEVHVMKMKALSGVFKIKSSANKDTNSFTIVGSNHGIVANNITIRQTKKSSSKNPINGTIGADADRRMYIKYLIDRYHEFKLYEVGKENMRYPIFYNSIKRKFGATWDYIKINKFEELEEFLKSRIDKTILAKKNKSNGKGSYHSFEEHIEQYG